MNLQLLDTLEILNKYHIEYYETGKNISSGWIGLNCPFCPDGDPSTHLGLHRGSNIISCWRCGKKGTIVDLIVALSAKSYRNVLSEISAYVAEDLYDYKEISSVKEIQLPKEFSRKITKNSYNYLLRRGFNPFYIWNKYELYNPIPEFRGRYNYRIVIPFFYENKMVTFTARDYSKQSDLRYLSLENDKSVISIGDCIYNIDQVSINSTIFIFEGPFDVWKFDENACAIYGIRFNSSKIAKLILDKRPERVYIIFDPGAESRAEQLAIELSVFTKVEVIFLNGHRDIGDFSQKEIKQFKKELGYGYI
jgi:hypothetical protein